MISHFAHLILRIIPTTGVLDQEVKAMVLYVSVSTLPGMADHTQRIPGLSSIRLINIAYLNVRKIYPQFKVTCRPVPVHSACHWEH